MADTVEAQVEVAEPSGMNAKERELHSRLLGWFESEMRRQSHNRYQMALDEDYYDSEQWLPAEKEELRSRGQEPVVYNEVKPMIDWLIGVERRTRTDFNIISTSDDSPEADESAKCKSKLLKYMAEANRLEFERSNAADDCFKAGLGWTEIGISPDPEDEPIYYRAESWRNMLHDSLATRLDLDDGRYEFRFRIVDLDFAKAYFPKKKDLLERSAVGIDQEHYLEWWHGKRIEEIDTPMPLPGKWTGFDSDAWKTNDRQRVLLIECWYREPTTETVGTGTAAIDRVRMKMKCTVMTEKGILLTADSPYKHNKFPFVPHWCYRRKKDGAPYSAIRAVRGPQDALNKRMSKALFVMSTNQVWAEKGAFDPKVMTAEEARDEARAPDAFVLLADGGLAKIDVKRENDVAQGHLQLAQVDQAIIRNSSGVSEENLNRTTSVQSGVALRQKAEQGTQLTAAIFDNLLLARQMEGEIMLSLAEQFYNQPKIFSIAGERSKREYVRINEPDPVTGKIKNDITARKAQFIIGEQPWKQSLMQAAFEKMMDLLAQMATVNPQLVTALLDVVWELADVPNKRTVLQRIRGVTGQTDPDEPLTPEQQASIAKQQEQADLQDRLALQQLMNDIKAAGAKGEELDAKALKTRIESLYVAMQAGQVVATVPGAAAVADELLMSVGFKDQHPNAVPPAAIAGPAPVAPMDGGAAAVPDPQLSDGAARGIQTPAADGLQPGAM
jgi:hypothetical protein